MKNNTERIVSAFFVCVMVAVIFWAVDNERQPRQDIIVCEESRSVENIIELTNRSRLENGVHPLVESEKLTKAAEAKADAMFEFQYFDHNSPEGESPFVFVRAVGYNYSNAGENLVMDFACAETAQQGLMDSPSHRRNILNEKFREIGVSIKHGILDGEETIFTVYFFGASK